MTAKVGKHSPRLCNSMAAWTRSLRQYPALSTGQAPSDVFLQHPGSAGARRLQRLAAFDLPDLFEILLQYGLIPLCRLDPRVSAMDFKGRVDTLQSFRP